MLTLPLGGGSAVPAIWGMPGAVEVCLEAGARSVRAGLLDEELLHDAVRAAVHERTQRPAAEGQERKGS